MRIADILTEAENMAVSTEFRDALRKWVQHHKPDDYAKTIAEISPILDAEMPVLTGAYSAFRSMTFPSPNDIPTELDFRSRSEITFGNRFVACTFREREQIRFARVHRFQETDNPAILMFFIAKTLPGARGVVVDDVLGDEEAARLLGGYEYDDSSEDEIILDRNSVFKVLEVRETPAAEHEHMKSFYYSGTVWDVKLEQVK